MTTTGSPRLSRPQLESLQTLLIRLMFSAPILEAYRGDPAATLAQYGLPAEAERLLPDPQSKNFLAESRGRQIVVEREISARFERTIGFFKNRARQPGPDTGPLDFSDFLSTDYFLGTAHALPHPDGVGPGYENLSKFFFWIKDRYGLNRPDANIALRLSVYADFALYLLTLRKKPCHPYYERFKGGVCWRQVPGRPAPIMLLTEEQVLAQITDPAKAAEILRVGITDLDTVEPEHWELEPAI